VNIRAWAHEGPALSQPLAAIGRSVLFLLAALGRVTLFGASAVSHIFRPPFYPREFGAALLKVGWFSLPVVGLLVVPVLVAVGDVIGIYGGFLVATGSLGFNPATYIHNTWNFLTESDMVSSLVKGAVFGFIATVMGCYHGMRSGRGAQGVGHATKTSVEAAAVLILAANFLLTNIFFSS